MLCLVAACLAWACDFRTEDDGRTVTPKRPADSEATPAEAACDLQAPRRVRRAVFRPEVVTEGDRTRLRVTFLDGSQATLTYPIDLRLTKDGARPDTTGGEPGRQVRPQISFGGVYFRLRGEPVRCVETAEGSPAGIWQHPDGEVLILRVGRWFVSVFESHTNLETWAGHLRGRVTRGGWLALKGDERLKIGPEQRYGDTSIMLGDLEPGVILWPLRCRNDEDTAQVALAATTDDKPVGKDAFASWCDRNAAMQVHVYASGGFIRRVAAGLRISEVDLVHPLRRYHIVP